MKIITTFAFLLLIIQNLSVKSQNIISDTTLISNYIKTANNYYEKNIYDSAAIYYKKTSDKYLKICNSSSLWKKYGYKYLQTEKKRGICYIKQYKLNSSIRIIKSALNKTLQHVDSDNKIVADTYFMLGFPYYYKSEMDSVLFFWQKTLDIKKNIIGENTIDVASCYNNIGAVYTVKSEYDLAIKNYLNALKIKKELLGEKNSNVATTYGNIGIAYSYKGEDDLALEYLFESLKIIKEVSKEKNIDEATSYDNIGIILENKKKYEKALKYYLKALEIRNLIYKKKHNDIALSYGNIANIYFYTKNYDKALKNYNKALNISKDLFGENQVFVASLYNDIGNVYSQKNKFDSALIFNLKAINIQKNIFGNKHTDLAKFYNNTGKIFKDNKDYQTALKYYQKAISSSIKNFNDTSDIYSVPEIKNYLNFNELSEALKCKAEIFADTNYFISKSKKERLKLSFQHFQACDTLISSALKNMRTKSDKISLGEKASDIYKEAVNVSLDLANKEINQPAEAQQLRAYAFYFSEKNKSSVLLDALAGAEAQKYAGIKNILLQKEHKLKTDIAFYKKILAEDGDSIKKAKFSDKLFKANRRYDSLIIYFEKEYPEYYDLKYNQKPASVKQISKIIDRKSAIISYQIGDSSITIFAIKRNEFFVTRVSKPKELNEKVENLRKYISDLTLLTSEIKSSTNKSVKEYEKTAFEFYNLLFPEEIRMFLGKNTKNLIIIPDGLLATLPFEVFHTEKYNTEWTGWSNKEYFSKMPYLVKKYNISYNYSANLFYKSFRKKKKQKDIEIKKLNDWLAFAPVFDNENIAGTALRTRKLLNKIKIDNFDTIKTRTFLKDGKYIYPLPGSLKETESIFKLFDEKNKSALLKTHLQANEEFAKSGELLKYKYLHFATHGIVDEEKPELSGLILAQDTASTEDNILFSGEIYNIKLNADLTVLSACETGLGKITKGEGIIGLTRALLYAGSKNIIVSLWQVSDESTNKLMVDFYKSFLNDKKIKNYGKHLRNAKIKMIKEEKFAHPFFWSPFILIGK